MRKLNLGKSPFRIAVAAIALAGMSMGTDAAAADFYKGKRITLIISTAPGGLYDFYGRLIAKHMPNHIAGKPSIVVQNMPGAGGKKATGFMFKIAERDGTVFAGTHSSIPASPLLFPKAARYDVNKFNWLGSVTQEPFVGYVWHTAPVKTYEDAKKTSVSMGGNSVGTGGIDMSIISNKWFGTKFKIITGYKGSRATKLALEKGEVQGTFANSWGDLKAQKMEWITNKKVRLLVQHGAKKHKELPHVPLFQDQAKTKAQRQGLKLMLANQSFSKPYFMPPGVPADRVAIMRKAFSAMIADPKFVAEATKLHLAVVDSMDGETLARAVGALTSTPKSVVASLHKLFNDYRAGVR